MYSPPRCRYAVETIHSIFLQDGKWYARVDIYYDGRRIGRPRIMWKQPHLDAAEAMFAARRLARQLVGMESSASHRPLA